MSAAPHSTEWANPPTACSNPERSRYRCCRTPACHLRFSRQWAPALLQPVQAKAEDIHDAAGKCRVTGRQFVNDSGPASGDIDINSIDGPGSILFTVYGTHAGAPVGYKMSDARLYP